MPSSTALTLGVPRAWRDYVALCKPKVVALIVFTAIVGMLLATPGMVPLDALVLGTLGIGGAAASGAAVNHLADRRIDALMARTSGPAEAATRSLLMFMVSSPGASATTHDPIHNTSMHICTR